MHNQRNIGSGNYNINVKTNIINFSSSEVTITDLWYKLIDQFAKEDDMINESLPSQLINKTGIGERYNSNKIISSLIKIGIPIPVAVEVARQMLDKVSAWIRVNSSLGALLSTKEVREMISLIIQNLDSTFGDRGTIDHWNNKYIRRYGHNNRIIQFYDVPSTLHKENTLNVSYDFINNILLPDVVKEINPSQDVDDMISSSDKKVIADDIIEFINNCDLYLISYPIFKSLVVEMATQPPHPWIINDELRSRNINYDREAVKINLSKAAKYIEANEVIPVNIIMEILHHSSTMTVARYFNFLGSYELSAFYLLIDILKKITLASDGSCTNSADDWDIVVSNYTFRHTYEDFILAKVSPEEYLSTMQIISSNIKTNTFNKNDSKKAIIRFAEMSLQIEKYGNSRELELFLQSDWSRYSQNKINYYIHTLLSFIFPCTPKSDNTSNKTHFWFAPYYIRSETIGDRKPQCFVFYINNDQFDEGLLSILHKGRTKAVCNTILFIIEDPSELQRMQTIIEECLSANELVDHYVPIFLSSYDCRDLFEAKDIRKCFETKLKDQFFRD